LHSAVAEAEEAVKASSIEGVTTEDASEIDYPDRLRALNFRRVLALALVARFMELKDQNDVDRAIQIYEALHLGKEALFATLWQFATALLCRGSSTDKILAGSMYAQGAADLVVAPTFRISSAIQAAKLLFSTDPEKAQSLLSTAVHLLPDLAPRQIEQKYQQDTIKAFAGVASNAAALTLDCGRDPIEAVQLLDAGRGIILGRLMDIRDDIPEKFAEKFKDLRELLDPPFKLEAPIEELDFKLDSKLNEAALDFEALKNEIRECDGFEDFGLPLTPETILNQAQHGPIIVLNVNEQRSDALIVTKSGVLCESLLDMQPSTVQAQVETFRKAIEAPTRCEPGTVSLRRGKRWRSNRSWDCDYRRLCTSATVMKILIGTLEISKSTFTNCHNS
jgi:hypothetical protein